MAATGVSTLTASDVARYFLALASEAGDLITNLKMQKLVYYAYAWTLARLDRRLFDEPIEAWPSGPVAPSLYQKLKGYGAGPIGEDFVGTEHELEALVERIPADELEILNGVYERYGTMPAFELVVRTHNEMPWREARQGLDVVDSRTVAIKDEHIFSQLVRDVIE